MRVVIGQSVGWDADTPRQTSRKEMERSPHGANEELQKAREASGASLDAIIEKKGEEVWLAYYGINKRAKARRGFKGQAELTKLLDKLKSEPRYWPDFAEQLASAMQGGEANGSESSAKRRRTTDDNHTEASVPPTITTSSADTHSIEVEHHVSERTAGHAASQGDVYIGAPQERAKQLFDERLWTFIERIPNPKQPDKRSADISMVFQQAEAREYFGCQMLIGVKEEKVAGLASKYFDVDVEIKDGVRSLHWPTGGKVEPDPSLKLRACRLEFHDMFRGELYNAVRESPIYLRERDDLLDRTDGISLTLSSQAKEGGKITVYLGEWRSFSIKARLYG